jgi:putative membrane protein
MLKMVIKWVLFALVIMGTCYLPGIRVENFAFAMLIAGILTIINIFIKPIIKLITFPINMLSFGLFNMILNFAILCAIAYYIPQYTIENYLSGFIASILVAVSYCIIKHC